MYLTKINQYLARRQCQQKMNFATPRLIIKNPCKFRLSKYISVLTVTPLASTANSEYSITFSWISNSYSMTVIHQENKNISLSNSSNIKINTGLSILPPNQLSDRTINPPSPKWHKTLTLTKQEQRTYRNQFTHATRANPMSLNYRPPISSTKWIQPQISMPSQEDKDMHTEIFPTKIFNQ